MPVAGLDTETFPITAAEPIPRLVCVSLDAGDGPTLHASIELDLFDRIVAALEGGIAGVNTPFDVFALLRWRPDLYPHIVAAYNAGRVHAVDLREVLIDVAEGMFYKRGTYGLGPILARRCGVELDKSDPWRLRYGELHGLPVSAYPPDAVRYASLDGWAHRAAWAAQEHYREVALGASGIDVFGNAAAQACAALPLYAQTLHGMHVDATRVAAVDAVLARMIGELTGRVLGSGLARVQGKSKPKVVRNVKLASDMFIELAPRIGFEVTMTQRGASLSEDELSRAQIPRDHPLDAFRRLGAVQSLRKKSIPPLLHPVVRTRYEGCVETGRTSSSAPGKKKKKAEESEDDTATPLAQIWPGTNLQNQLKGCVCGCDPPCGLGPRECLVPPPAGYTPPSLPHIFVPTSPAGYYLAKSDFSGAELVTLAQIEVDLFGSSTLGDVIREGRDAHAELGADLIKVARHLFDPKGNREHKNARALAKPVNFGFPGGLGPRKMVDFARTQYGTIMSEAEARVYKRAWLEAWPEHGLYLDWIAAQEGPDGLITVRQHRSGRIRGACRYTEACNSHFQGLAADGAKTALWWLWLAQHDRGSPLYACPQVLFVHDENVTVVPRDPKHEPWAKDVARASDAACGCRSCDALREQERIMIGAFAVWCPDVPVRVESSLLERYTS